MFRNIFASLHIGVLLAVASLGVSLFAGEQDTAKIDFARDVQPILSDKCYTCHGPDESTRQADLRLDTEAGLLSHSNVIPGNPDDSELIRRLTSDDPDERMPPPDSNLRITNAEVKSIRSWVEAGAKWSRHWAYQPISRTRPPRNYNFHSSNPIDSFVAARLQSESLSPGPPADRRRLIRRATLDLTGLPPTPEEVNDFIRDGAPSAFECVVDRLLASPAYGERMAWPWLDAARYSDSNGFQGDGERTMWPWRDWTITAINDNLAYDQFTVWQIAGDQLPNATSRQKLATGFCRNHMINGEGGRIPAENRVEYIFDQLETVGTIWLGMTMQCCRCHDHKFDPITQDEYFQLFAFFNQTPVDGSGGNPQTPPVLPVASESQQRELEHLDDRAVEAAQRVARYEATHGGIGKLFNAETAPAAGESTEPIFETAPNSRSIEQLKQLEQHSAETHPDYAAMIKSLRELSERRQVVKSSLPRVMIMEDMDEDKYRTTHVLERGLYNKPLHEVSASTPAALLPLAVTSNSSNPNRLDLARWLVAPDHPLTARVTVNRLWQTFFGTGLVETAEDFGRQSKRPSHPMLLDWLASELIRTDWDTKHIVRLIVTSSVYQQSSKNPESIKLDPTNRLLARGPRFRLPSWMLRDQALSVAGLLTRPIGGPPVKPYQPAGVWSDATFGKKKYERDRGENLYRRSIYVFWRRIVGPTMFFDAGKRQTCEVRITRTNTPLHALATLNDIAFVEAARAMAQRLFVDVEGDDSSRMDYAFQLATSRLPSDEERVRLLQRLGDLETYYERHSDDAGKILSTGDSSHETSIPPAKHAAYTCICLLILNLDETLTN